MVGLAFKKSLYSYPGRFHETVQVCLEQEPAIAHENLGDLLVIIVVVSMC